MNHLIKEACVESLSECIIAEQLEANQLELCSRLDLDGLTPDIELIQHVLSKVKIPVKVMIRPRGGDFSYTDTEIQTMETQIIQVKQLGINEVVFGALKEDNSFDFDVTKRLAKAAYPMKITFHKAIDSCNKPLETIDQLKKIPNIAFILTSGREETAEKGIRMLQKMIQVAGHEINIIAAGKVTIHNLLKLSKQLDTLYFHGRKIVGELKSQVI